MRFYIILNEFEGCAVLCNKYLIILNNSICMLSNRSGGNVTRDVPYARLMEHSPTNILPPKLDSDSVLNAERSKSILNVPETEAAPKSSASDSKLAVDYFNTAVTKESCQQGTTNVVLVCGAELRLRNCVWLCEHVCQEGICDKSYDRKSENKVPSFIATK
jgi:hypothetical protein